MFGISDRWMTKELALASVAATLAMSGPVIMISVYTNLPGNALYSALLWPSLLSIVPMILYHTMPVLAAMAIVWCYGRFASDGALVALHMAGRSNLSVRAPGLLVAIAAMIVGYLLSSVVAPHTASHLHDVLYSIRYNLTPSLLQIGKFNKFGSKGDVVYIESRVGYNKFSNVFILKRRGDEGDRAYAARHAVFEQQGDEQVAILLDGSTQIFSSERNEIKIINFDSMTLPMAKAASVARLHRTVDELSPGDFVSDGASSFDDPARARSWMREALNRFVIPGLVLPHVLLGLELLAFSGILTDRKRDSVALICAGLALFHFGEVFVIEQVGANIHWVWMVAAMIAAEYAAAASITVVRSGQIAKFRGLDRGVVAPSLPRPRSETDGPLGL
jgi:lipopolysaccharide export LptBFGC system permease protein LptF